jgi:hypothetical protein
MRSPFRSSQASVAILAVAFAFALAACDQQPVQEDKPSESPPDASAPATSVPPPDAAPSTDAPAGETPSLDEPLPELTDDTGSTEGPDTTESTDGMIMVVGVLTDEGTECQALRADDGTLYTLIGEADVHPAGTRVRVAGTLVEVSFCMQGTTLNVAGLEKIE